MRIVRTGIYLVIFCLPLYLIRFKILGLPTNVLEAMIGGLFIIWLAQKGFKGIKKDLRGLRGIIWAIALILIGVSIATIFSWNLRVSAGIWKGWFMVPLVFFIIFITTIKPEEIKKIFWSFVFSGLVVSVISLIYLLLGKLNYQGRLQGIFDSPNYLAMYLAPILIIALLRKNVLFLLPAIALFFTKSYGAWLGILIALIFGFLLYLYQKNRKKLFFLLIFLCFAIIFILGLIKIQSLEGLKSFDARFVIWQKAWQVFLSNFPEGIGPGTFENYFPLYPKWGVPQPHNLYLAFLLQTGIIGFVGFVLVLIWFFREGFKNFQFSIFNFQSIFKLQLSIVMVYILVHGLVDTTYWKNDLAIIFWTLIGTMAIIKESR